MIGGFAGCGLAFLVTPAVLRLIGNSVPRAADAGVDLRVLGFSVVLSLVAGLIFGIIPAIASSRANLVSTLKEGGRSEIAGRDWLRSSLVVAQVALGLVLAAGAGLLISSFTNLQRADEGFNPDNLLPHISRLRIRDIKRRGRSSIANTSTSCAPSLEFSP